MNRNIAIAASVLVFHVAALWALQSGLLRRAVELLVPAEILVEFIASAPPEPKPVQVPIKKRVAESPSTVKNAVPLPLATTDPTPSPLAPIGVIAPMAVAPQVTAPATVATNIPIRVQLPSSDADYLQNPKPPYPPLSKRMGEQGKVVLRVFIEIDGKAQKAEIKQSSGFERLDQAALKTALLWRYLPGKRAGIAEAMWFNVPINFVLE